MSGKMFYIIIALIFVGFKDLLDKFKLGDIHFERESILFPNRSKIIYFYLKRISFKKSIFSLNSEC